MKKRFFLLSLLALLGIASNEVSAQRIQQPLGRGVVAVKNGNNAFISWRKLAQEAEDIQYNVYVNGTRLNSAPLSNTHYPTEASLLPTGSQVTVTFVSNGTESSHSTPYTVGSYDVKNMFMSIRFDNSPLTAANYNTAYVWPADLDGDGEMDYVVNRKNNSNSLDCYVEAYLRTGEYLWTVKLGPNELSCAGQDDMILAYDMDCDGKADVVMQTSDGTQFWDAEKKDFGLYVNGHTTGDTDGDGIIDYETQSQKNAPRYMTVVDGMTGKEKHSVEQTYNSSYNRTNRSSLMGDEYNKHVGHVGVFYPDGIHPAVIMEWHTRYTDGSHHYYNSAFTYDFSTGKASEWKELFCKPTGGPAFHQIRIADVDGDGRDEMQTGGYTMDDDGETLNAPGISHGDRFRTSDIDPERPGLETFAIQQDAGDMLGQILYDAATGDAIKKWYLSAVGDVGRGESMDVDPNHLGWEMWSTMGGVYNAQGELIPEHTAPFPTEGIWWDNDPDREIVQSSDSHYNVYIQDFYKGRLIEIAKLSNWRYVTVYAKRAAFWGDMVGDWREELILLHKENDVCVGIVGFSTDYTTAIDNIYCLQEDPAYRMQCTTKGYYQSPDPGFYLGYDMPRPQLPPCMVTDLVWKATGTFTNYERSAPQPYSDGKSMLIDLHTASELALDSDIQPSVVYAMPVKDQSVTLHGNGALRGTMELWKSQAGTLVLNTPLSYTGKTVISEGTLEVNNEICSPIELRARGTLAGNATVNSISFEGALNYEGGRIAPGTEAHPIGSITFRQGLTIDRRTFLEMDITDTTACDRLLVEGDLTVTAPTTFTIHHNDGELAPGKYRLIEYTDIFTGDINHFTVRGLTGLSYSIVNDEQAIYLIIYKQRSASAGVKWMGTESNVWDYQTRNFVLDGASTEFVAGDEVLFTDEASTTTLTVDNLMPIQCATFSHTTKSYTFNGNGGFSGNGSLVMDGTGHLTLNTVKSDYIGATIIHSGTVTVKELADGGIPSSLGAATVSADNWQMGKATLVVDNSNTSTNRGLTLTDTATIHINSGATALKGAIKGNGTLIKSGAGQLNLNAINTFTGGIVLQEGTLAQGAWDATLAKSGSAITVANGTLTIFNNNTTSAVPNLNHKITVPEGGKLTLNAGQRCKISGSFHGEGSITLTIPYVRTDMAANWSNFNGSLTVTGRDFRLNQATDFKGTALTLGDEVNMGHYKSGSGTTLSQTTSIGSLAATSTTATVANGTYNVGYNNKNTTFAGKLTCTIHKYGTGNWTLTGTANTATVSIHQGAILANNSSGTVATSITVMDGAALYGKGHVKNVSLKKGSKLMAGQATYLNGTLTINGTLTSEGGATVLLKINKVNNDKLHLVGTAAFGNDTLEIAVTNRTISEGEEFQLFQIDKSLTHSFIIKGTPGEGLMWDTTDLSSTGILRAVSADGIHAVGEGSVAVYPQIVTTLCHIDASRACTGAVTLQLTDANGRIIDAIQFDAAHIHTLDMSNYPAGLYFIRLSNNGESKVVRVMKVK